MCNFFLGLMAMMSVDIGDLKITRTPHGATSDKYVVMGVPKLRVDEIRGALWADPDINNLEIHTVKDFATIKFIKDLHGIRGSRRGSDR